MSTVAHLPWQQDRASITKMTRADTSAVGIPVPTPLSWYGWRHFQYINNDVCPKTSQGDHMSQEGDIFTQAHITFPLPLLCRTPDVTSPALWNMEGFSSRVHMSLAAAVLRQTEQGPGSVSEGAYLNSSGFRVHCREVSSDPTVGSYNHPPAKLWLPHPAGLLAILTFRGPSGSSEQRGSPGVWASQSSLWFLHSQTRPWRGPRCCHPPHSSPGSHGTPPWKGPSCFHAAAPRLLPQRPWVRDPCRGPVTLPPPNED